MKIKYVSYCWQRDMYNELQRRHCSASVAVLAVLVTLLSTTYARQTCKRIALLRFHGNCSYTNQPRYYIVHSLCSLLQMRFDASKLLLQCASRTKHDSVETHLYIKGKLVLNSVQQSVELLYILTHARFVWIKFIGVIMLENLLLVSRQIRSNTE